MPDNGVTHKELNDALGKQTARIIATIRRSEDKVDDKIDKVSDRVTYIERWSRIENVVASTVSSVLTFFGIVIYGKYTGGN